MVQTKLEAHSNSIMNSGDSNNRCMIGWEKTPVTVITWKIDVFLKYRL